MLESAGISTGLLTTAQIKLGELRSANPEHVTTPEAPQLQLTLRRWSTPAIRRYRRDHLPRFGPERVDEIAYDIPCSPT